MNGDGTIGLAETGQNGDEAEARCKDVGALAAELCREAKRGIDLRFTPHAYHPWCVMVDVGNYMDVVPGSIAATPEDALRLALERWRTRSREYPFVVGGEY
jgi:hypothetical protein